MEELWKDIIGYEGLYQVSNIGNIRKIAPFARKINCSRCIPYLLSKAKSSTGYIHVQLVKQGKAKTINVHRLVANAFVPNPYHKNEINHIDSDRSNNVFTNLEWVTHRENMIHAVKQCHVNPSIMRNHKKKRYTVLQYSKNGEFIREWNCVNDIALKYGIRRCTIYLCLSGNHKSALGYMWVKRLIGDSIKDKIEPFICMTGKTQKPRNRKIIQLDKQNNVICIWNSYHEILNDKSFGKNTLANIMKCANGKRKSAYGFIWKYI